MHPQRTCVRHETPLTNTTNRINRDPGLRAFEHTCVCARDITDHGSLLKFCHTRSQHAGVGVTTPVTEPTARSRDHGFLDPETHLCATTDIY